VVGHRSHATQSNSRHTHSPVNESATYLLELWLVGLLVRSLSRTLHTVTLNLIVGGNEGDEVPGATVPCSSLASARFLAFLALPALFCICFLVRCLLPISRSPERTLSLPNIAHAVSYTPRRTAHCWNQQSMGRDAIACLGCQEQANLVRTDAWPSKL